MVTDCSNDLTIRQFSRLTQLPMSIKTNLGLEFSFIADPQNIDFIILCGVCVYVYNE